ncbi:MAG TPA: cation transporter, partial [Ilumatobacteraceae bacterium]
MSITTAENVDTIELDVAGMTCAACATRIEKKLNRLHGVSATVNYATERAAIELIPDADAPSVVEMISTIESIGYGASVHVPLSAAGGDAARSDRVDALRRRLIVSAVLGLPVLLMSMVPALQFRGWQWVAMTIAVPVVTWAAWPFHLAAWRNLVQRSATMDTLVSLGVIAAFGRSMWSLFIGSAGMIGMTMRMSLVPARSARTGSELYFEVACSVVVFMLAGRWFEARAKRRSGAALRALLDLGAKDVAVMRGGTEVRVPVEGLRVGDTFVVRPGERIAADGEVIDGSSAVDASMLTGESVPIDIGPGSRV